METVQERISSNTIGVVCTVLGGGLTLWVVARLASAIGAQQTWAPPLGQYEWVTLGGAGVAAALLIVGLMRWTRPRGAHGASDTSPDPEDSD